ncbi:MAG: oligopeptide/dipeptide ABC transporter ATPase, peptide/nickel transport system ATP-binding protein [Armatimonadetes bacterium CSP1-3]|nr:MAG: oligopeptide/dipeptide ABC transporter ATPase, peptide/nickel transport system ATP-binding protein [Armatimonadetes bacterium CSP1-3]
MNPIVVFDAVTRIFQVRGSTEAGTAPGARIVQALDRVSFAVREGEILGLAGESGSGKSTIAELMAALQTPTNGRVLFNGEDLAGLRGAGRREFHRRVQMIFQDPYESINPQHLIRWWVEEPLEIHGIGARADRLERVRRALAQAELRPPDAFLNRYPHQLSGGQRQRVAIARAIVLEPSLLVADEPVSMLDVSVRAGILRLLRRLRDELDLTILYISHDLSTVRYIADRVAILYQGKLVEIGGTDAVMRTPLHPYTQALMSAVPTLVVAGPRRPRVLLPAGNGSAATTPSCRFAARCPHAMNVCRQREPLLVELAPGHAVACFLHSEAAVPQPGGRA